MANINTTEIAGFLIPLPNLTTQRRLVEPLQGAWEDRRKKVRGAHDELVAINDALMARWHKSRPAGVPGRSLM